MRLENRKECMMTKENYFYLLWAISSIASSSPAVLVFMGVVPVGQFSPIVVARFAALGIVINAFMVTMGIYFAQKIGARLLFLDGNYDYKRDIVKPGIITGVVVSNILLILNVVFSNYLFFETYSGIQWYVVIQNIVSVLTADIFLLLCLVSGLALVIKKITKKMSSGLFAISMLIVMFLRTVFPLIWMFGLHITPFNAHMINGLVNCIIDGTLGVLFWKKGFETAVLCHLVIVIIFYVVVPLVVHL